VFINTCSNWDITSSPLCARWPIRIATAARELAQWQFASVTL